MCTVSSLALINSFGVWSGCWLGVIGKEPEPDKCCGDSLSNSCCGLCGIVVCVGKLMYQSLFSVIDVIIYYVVVIIWPIDACYWFMSLCECYNKDKVRYMRRWSFLFLPGVDQILSSDTTDDMGGSDHGKPSGRCRDMSIDSGRNSGLATPRVIQLAVDDER
jgi:hypothetical protein